MGGTLSLWMSERLSRLSFEDGYTRLEQVIHRLEAGELSLDESIALYEEDLSLSGQALW